MNRRAIHKQELVNSLSEAQKIAFAPLTFQAVNALLELGILKEIDREPASAENIREKLELSEYTVKTLLEVGEAAGIFRKVENKFSITRLGEAFLYDEMTRVNFNFVKDVCYLGADRLTQSFRNQKPEGLKEIYPDAETIYTHISRLPERMKKSWYEFDHYYSDNSFDLVYEILKPCGKIFDIGANTGKFERVCLKNNPNQDITMIDLKENIDYIKDNPELRGCKFYAANILNSDETLPQMSGAVLMSQFLDCFSKEQIIFILKKIAKSSDDNIKIFILEPFIDMQKFEGAKYSLIHTSLYFTCMANGCSKMYSKKDMEKMIECAGWKVNAVYDKLGAHDYTLLECVKNG